jgi:CDP-diacylglycerol---serine O-phosphatidyltransferase
MKLKLPHQRLWPKNRPETASDPGDPRRKPVKRTIMVLPTLFTLGNVLCGFMAIFIASQPKDTALPMGMSTFTFATCFIFLGMLMDALDGQVARMTKTTSNFGEQLDSMADMVTFGIAPAFMAIKLVEIRTPFNEANTLGIALFDRTAFVIAMIYVSCTAIRLARFNVEVHLPSEADHSGFKGIPSPGAAGTVASLVILHQSLLNSPWAWVQDNQWLVKGMPVFTVWIMLLVAFAMVSRLRYAHLANRLIKNRGKARINTVVWLIIFILFLTIFPKPSLALGFTLYALSAPTLYVWRKLTGCTPQKTAPQTVSPLVDPQLPHNPIDGQPITPGSSPVSTANSPAPETDRKIG